MDSSSPSTLACDSSDCSDARNGEGLAVDEILRIKEKRLRLLDVYRNEQEESILPLMREADDINRKKKKKSNGQFHAENNAFLRRSERIMIQTLNDNRTLESPMHQPELEPDPIFEHQHEPEFEPEPALREESEPETEPTDESESELEPTDESEPETEPTDESEPETEPTDESEPEPVSMDESEPETEPTDESEPEPVSMDESEPEPISMDESEPEPVTTDESEPKPVSTDESEPELVLTDGSEAELVSTDDSEPELVPRDEPEQEGPPRHRRVVRRVRSPRRRFQVERPGRHFFDVQLALRHIFAVHPARRHVVDSVPVPRWGHPAFNGLDNWYGGKEGFDIGYHWNTRLECSHDKVHRPSIAGIHPGPHGAYSVALSGAYPEDIDRGNVVIFTGAGGRDLRGASGKSRNVRSAPQVRDQELNKANLSLIRSVKTGNPVRLIRGHKLASSFAPEHGYRYDGLYRVVRFWYGRGYSGFRVFRFKMFRLKNQTPPPWETAQRREIHQIRQIRRRGPARRRGNPTPPPRDPTPPPSDPTPPPRDPTPPPRDPTPPPSTSAGPSRKRAKEQNDSFPDTAGCEELDDEIERCIRKLCQNSSYNSDGDDGSPPFLFRGWNMP